MIDFKELWEFVQKSIHEDYHDTIYIPDQEKWEEVREDLLSAKKFRIKRHSGLQASLPKCASSFEGYFDEELLNKKILLP